VGLGPVGLGCQLGIDQLPVKRWGDRSAAGAKRIAGTNTNTNTAAAQATIRRPTNPRNPKQPLGQGARV